jgi:hypothetical protein
MNGGRHVMILRDGRPGRSLDLQTVMKIGASTFRSSGGHSPRAQIRQRRDILEEPNAN